MSAMRLAKTLTKRKACRLRSPNNALLLQIFVPPSLAFLNDPCICECAKILNGEEPPKCSPSIRPQLDALTIVSGHTGWLSGQSTFLKSVLTLQAAPPDHSFRIYA